ncbi:MAG: hypothetical protein WKF78_00470 [Candidatus Limnocylindrales bacterium]
MPAGAAPPDPAASGPAIDALQTPGRLTSLGSGSLREIAAGHAGERPVVLTNGPEIPRPKRPNGEPDTRVTPAVAPDPATSPGSRARGGMLAFGALTHADSRFADNGNQHSGEPPDQALCVGSGFTLEMVNQVVTVYNDTGSQLVPDASINEFYGLAPNITRTDPLRFGPFVFDLVCLYDAQLERWFVVNTDWTPTLFTGEYHRRIASLHSRSAPPATRPVGSPTSASIPRPATPPTRAARASTTSRTSGRTRTASTSA